MVDYGFHTARSFVYVATESSDKAYVVVRIDENFYVEEIAQLFVFKNKYSFNNHDAFGLFFYPVTAAVNGIIVSGVVDFLPRLYRNLHAFAAAQSLQVLHQQLGIKGIRVVEVFCRTLFEGQIFVVLVIVVMAQEQHLVGFEVFYNFVGEGGFSATRSARNADYDTFHI